MPRGKPASAEWCLVKVKRQGTDTWLEGGAVGKVQDTCKCIFNDACKPFAAQAQVDRIRGHVAGVEGHHRVYKGHALFKPRVLIFGGWKVTKPGVY